MGKLEPGITPSVARVQVGTTPEYEPQVREISRANPILQPTGLEARRLVLLLAALAALLAICQAWGARHLMNPDGVSYLDIADAARRGEWHAAVNAYWNPLYAWLLGVGLSAFAPSPFWEFPIVRVVNVVIYLVALCCFHFFLSHFIRFDRQLRSEDGDAHLTSVPEPVWWTLGYTVFILFSLDWIGVEVVSPDLCVAGLIFLAGGLLLRMHLRQGGLASGLALGACLGIAYLAKVATSLPVIACFVAAAVWASGRRRWARAAGIGIALALVAGPWVYTLSTVHGHFTVSDAGKLNYAWYVNAVPRHWQGEMPGFGTPRHPHPQILAFPAAFAYDPTAPGTYPGWFDPARWFDGVTPRLQLGRQLYAMKSNAFLLFEMTFDRAHVALIVGMLGLFVFSGNARAASRRLRQYWFLLVPAVLTLIMYGLIWVESRFFGATLAMMWLALFSSLRLSAGPESRAVLRGLTVAMCAAILIAVSGKIVTRAYQAGRESPKDWQIADFLHRSGIQPDDRVAVIGRVNRCGWARLARVKITAEIPPESEGDFDTADEVVQARAVNALFGTGVRAVVSDHRVATGCASGWKPAGGTGFYLCRAADTKLN